MDVENLELQVTIEKNHYKTTLNGKDNHVRVGPGGFWSRRSFEMDGLPRTTVLGFPSDRVGELLRVLTEADTVARTSNAGRKQRAEQQHAFNADYALINAWLREVKRRESAANPHLETLCRLATALNVLPDLHSL
ncbi:hypothetical protein PQR29_03255 [Paraburkholderia strydomiana]|uniref:hypothetical protein n=1 Tax=Paraburkholderia strydomiana TaxID=1245417 RepID=UPI0038B970A3